MRITSSGRVVLTAGFLLASSWFLGGARPAIGADTAVKAEPAALHIKPAVSYTASAGLDGEIFPVFANYASLQKPDERQWASVVVTVHNSGDQAVRNRISVQVPGWSDQEIQFVEVPARSIQICRFAPVFLARFYRNYEIAAATAVVTATDVAGQVVFSGTVPVHLRPASDMYWGTDFKFAPFIASWVTPHEPAVEAVLSRAKEFMPGRRLPGYEEGKSEALQERTTILEAQAIYQALHAQGVSYVKSSITFGANQDWSERVRMPSQSLRANSANCIDGVLLYASLFENLGMDPVIVLVPGHAYIGVRLTPYSDRYLYVETAYTGRTGFDAATAAAQRALARYNPSEIKFIRIAEARQSGIYPMPQ